MSESTITIIVAIIGSGAFSTLVSQICGLVQRRAEKKSGASEGPRLIMKDKIRVLCVHYIEQGWIYEDELEDLMAMHSCYHDKLKGYGYLDVLMAKVKALEIRGVGV